MAVYEVSDSELTNRFWTFRRKMAKRKMDCGLDDIVTEYLKKVKCEKSSKMFGTEGSGGSDHSKSLKKFIKFLKQSEMKKEKRDEDDLGFEINFGAFQPEQKVSFSRLFVVTSQDQTPIFD